MSGMPPSFRYNNEGRPIIRKEDIDELAHEVLEWAFGKFDAADPTMWISVDLLAIYKKLTNPSPPGPTAGPRRY